jgi:hypothetical protein
MAKQTFTTGQVLTAAQMTSLQQTAMLGGAASAKVASYTLVAADAGTAITMSNASATTITVNTALFAAGDVVNITNLGVGVCTITAGTATVNTSASLALAQYESGTLEFISTSAAVFVKGAGAAAGGGGKVLQVVQASYSTATTIATTTFTDTGLSLSITPTLNTSKILVIVNQSTYIQRESAEVSSGLQILRGATTIFTLPSAASAGARYIGVGGSGFTANGGIDAMTFLDSPATTSATTYKTQAKMQSATLNGSLTAQPSSVPSVITLLEIGA